MLPLTRSDAISILKDEMCKHSLARYFDIFQDNKYSKFLITKKIPTEFNPKYSMENLWVEHNRLMDEYVRLEKKIDSGILKINDLKTPKRSFLDLKIEISKRILENCHLCMHKDGANRISGEVGYCRCGSKIVTSNYFEHMGEEPELVPSGTIFTCGCTMRCLHCQNWSISQMFESGEILSYNMLAKIIERMRKRDCRNVNLVGGDPTPWIGEWLKVFKYVNHIYISS